MAFIKNIEHETVLPISRPGNCTAWADRQPHAVYAEESFKMLLTVVFPTEQE